jgi:hypothetical protein
MICKADMDLLPSPLENFRAAQPNLIFSPGLTDENGMIPGRAGLD